MPFVIVESGNVAVGRTFDAVLCDANIAGFPDHRRDSPVQVRLLSEGMLLIEPDDAREIISSVTENSTTKFAVAPGRKAIVASVRRGRLAQASALLQQLTACLKPLMAESEEPELAAEGLQMLFDWLAREREHEKAADGVRHVPR